MRDRGVGTSRSTRSRSGQPRPAVPNGRWPPRSSYSTAPEGVDVRRRGGPVAPDLLGRRVLRREQGHPRPRRAVLPVLLEEARDPEVEELHRPRSGHQDVRRLQVTVDDEVPVRVVDGVDHLQHEADAIRHVQPGVLGVAPSGPFLR